MKAEKLRAHNNIKWDVTTKESYVFCTNGEKL